MGHFLISSLKSWFFADTSPGVVRRIRAEVVALDDDVGWASDEDKIEREFASSVVVGGKKEHESLDCGHVVVLTVDAASGAVVSVEKIVEAPSEQVPVEDGRSPFICEVGETIFECYCVVTRVVGGKNLGDVVVDVDGGKRFSFQLRTCRGDFRPKRDDELAVKWEIKEDGQEVPISFKAVRVEEWREACVVKEARFGDRNYNRRPELGVLRYRNKKATFDAHVVKVRGSKYLPRCLEVVYARVIGTNDRFRPWRAIDVKTTMLGLQAGVLLSGADPIENVEPKGLFVLKELNFGCVNRNQRVEQQVQIINESGQLFTLLCASFDDPVAQKIFELKPDRFPAEIAPGTTLVLKLVCDRAGSYEIPASDTLPFHFRFAGGVSIDRMVHAMFDEPAKKENKLIQRTTQAPRPNAQRKWAHFEAYSLPPQLMKIAREGGDIRKLYPYLTDPLTPENYVAKFKAMVHLQHLGEECELSKMRLTGVTMATRGECLTLNVPDLKDGRPSLLVSDSVIVSECRSLGRNTHEGRIVKICDLTLFVKFDRDFQVTYSGQEVDVSFKVSVGGFVRCNHALSRLDDRRVNQLVFPVKELEMKPVMQVADEGLLRPYRRPDGMKRAQRDSYPSVKETASRVFKLRWFNADLNERQRQAVKYIVSSGSRIPYLLFGPPGTGKTVTVVEAVMQVFHMDPRSRIMVATPSNSAADLICSLLSFYVERGWLEKTQLVRCLAQQRHIASVPDSIRDYVVQDDPENQVVSDICVDRIVKSRIMVATWHMCGSLHEKSIRSNFFSHVFVDEAGHLTEPQCLVPMTLCDAKRVILAGDPEQLGPVIMSEPAKLFGMSESMLERLMRENQAYLPNASMYPECGGYDPMVVTKLVENYRSRPKILELYSNLCYAGDLIPRVPDDGVPAWVPDTLKNRFPLLVVGIRGGVCQRESKNPSPFNEMELFYVHIYAVMLTGSGISARDVGVVTPYRCQAQKIREKLRDSDLAEVKVGSVEEFQGSERRVIIVSTVHTVKTAEGKRRWKNDGFWANSFFSSKRHTNVAISRAQDFLVVIGDVELLTKDEHWGQIVSKARDGGDKHFLLVGQRPS